MVDDKHSILSTVKLLLCWRNIDLTVISMRNLICCAIALLLVGCAATKSTDRLLEEVWNDDQQPRHQLMELTKAVTVEGRTELIDSLITVNDIVERNDAKNIKIIDKILERGFPQGLSEESYKTIWIVIDHAPLEKQEQYLPLVEQMATEDYVGLDEYAILYDRIAMGQNRPQRYGSQLVQFGRADAQKLYVWPVEDAEKLDSLRNSVAMSSFCDYLKRIEERTGITPMYDPTLSIEVLNQMRTVDR